MTEMEEIVELLRQRHEKNDKISYSDLQEIVAERNKKLKPKKEEPRIVVNDRAATIVWPNGFSFAIDFHGVVTWAYDGKRVDPALLVVRGADDQIINTPIVEPHDLQCCIKHIIDLHMKHCVENCKKVKAVDEPGMKMVDKDRTRYIKSGDTKRAFVAGMILGKKNAVR